MTPEEFKRAGIRMYGSKHWRRGLSINLGLDPSTVWRVSTRQKDVSPVVEVAVKGLLEKHKQLATAEKLAREQRARERHRYKGKLTHRKGRKANVRSAPSGTGTDATLVTAAASVEGIVAE